MSAIINGDITKVIKSGYILHQVNCMSAMGAGVALALMKKWPQVRSEYIQFSKQAAKPKDLLGQIEYVQVENNLTVINSFTQLGYGNARLSGVSDTNEELLIRNIRNAAKKAASENTTVAVPYLVGCGLAGGNWQNVYNGIKDLDNLIIVKYGA